LTFVQIGILIVQNMCYITKRKQFVNMLISNFIELTEM
jgi:hypothetical protein